MPNRAVIGTQWGDEGKGKVVDILSESSDIVARCQGGANAGHTVVCDGNKFILHLIPSGILHPDCICLLGNGVVIDLDQLFREMEHLNSQGIETRGRIFVSGFAHLVLPYHKWTEEVNERRLGDHKIGTTLRGIGPAYTDKYARAGIRVYDLFQPDSLREKLEANFASRSDVISEFKNEYAADIPWLHAKLCEYGRRLEGMAVDGPKFLSDARAAGKTMLFEGAQGTHLDIDFGTFPFVTSSNTTIGGAMTGLGIPPFFVDEIFGVVKAYSTRVGSGPFPTELTDSLGETIRGRGQEFGATTGRPRRCGWLDLELVKRSVMINGIGYLALTKLDVLDGLSEIRVCVGYNFREQGQKQIDSPFFDLRAVEPAYRIFPGWSDSTTGARNLSDLPAKAREYVDFIQEYTGSRIALISTGPSREDTILIPPLASHTVRVSAR